MNDGKTSPLGKEYELDLSGQIMLKRASSQIKHKCNTFEGWLAVREEENCISTNPKSDYENCDWRPLS